jgi:hypothetical protein
MTLPAPALQSRWARRNVTLTAFAASAVAPVAPAAPAAAAHLFVPPDGCCI